jgi:hypothetical protein
MELKVKALALGAAVAIAACGGDDGSSGRDVGYTGSTAQVTIDEANVGSVAATANAQATAFAGSDVDGAITVIGAARSGPRAVVREALALAAARRDARVTVTGAVWRDGGACDASGSASVVFDDGNDPVVTEAGEYMQMSFDGCSFDGLTTFWGGFRITLTATDGLDPTQLDTTSLLTSGFDYGMRIDFDDFVMQDAAGDYVGTDGDVAMSIRWDAGTYTLTSTLTGTSLANEAGNGSTVVESSLLRAIPGVSDGYSFTAVEQFTSASALYLAAEEVGAVARMCSLEIAGCIDLEIAPRLRKLGAAVYPESGTMRVTGAAGAYVEIVVVDAAGAITLEYDLDGPGAAAAFGPISTTWACLDTPGFCQPE